MTTTQCNLCGVRLEGAPMHAILCSAGEARVPDVQRHIARTLTAARALYRHRRRHPFAPSPPGLRRTLFDAYAAFRADIARARAPDRRERGP